MYDAYVAAIIDDNDPSSAVEALLEATDEAIAKADDPVDAIGVFVRGLSSQVNRSGGLATFDSITSR